MLTSARHTSGTDRVAEVAAAIPEAEIIVNVQGDEPLISPQTIEKAVEVMTAEIQKLGGDSEGAGIVTTWEPIESIDDLLESRSGKGCVDDDENAVYFSRSPIPYPRDAVQRHGSPDVALAERNRSYSNFFASTRVYTSIVATSCSSSPVAADWSRTDRSTRATARPRTRRQDQGSRSVRVLNRRRHARRSRESQSEACDINLQNV